MSAFQRQWLRAVLATAPIDFHPRRSSLRELPEDETGNRLAKSLTVAQVQPGRSASVATLPHSLSALQTASNSSKPRNERLRLLFRAEEQNARPVDDRPVSIIQRFAFILDRVSAGSGQSVEAFFASVWDPPNGFASQSGLSERGKSNPALFRLQLWWQRHCLDNLLSPAPESPALAPEG